MRGVLLVLAHELSPKRLVHLVKQPLFGKHDCGSDDQAPIGIVQKESGPSLSWAVAALEGGWRSLGIKSHRLVP